MAKYRQKLPQLSDKLFLTDGGLETTLIFHNGFDLPEFAAFVLLQDGPGRKTLEQYFRTYTEIARSYRLGFVLESMTWRASSSWGQRLGYKDDALVAANRNAVEMLADIRNDCETEQTPMVISGCMGPRGDGYNVADKMSASEAESYHRPQIAALQATEADMVSALTMNYSEEAIGLSLAAQATDMPVVISFTVETDGCLPSGEMLGEAVEAVDEATGAAPVYYMINCAHPSHFEKVLVEGGPWLERIKGLRANASAKSHAELDEAEELDDGDPLEFGKQYRRLREKLPQLNVLGGCCGTDHRHILEICKACIN
jgi:S-methylmethionine-dependent homocysteine/selenocysteine methylase